MAHIFISYARDDDEPFAQRLAEDLTGQGLEVWWDREAHGLRTARGKRESRPFPDSAPPRYYWW